MVNNVMPRESWDYLTEEEAKQHRLYGVRGWLLTLIVFMSIGTLASGWNVFSPSGRTMTEAMYGASASWLVATNAVLTFAYLVIIIMAIAKHSLFPRAAQIVFVGNLLLTAVNGILISSVSSPGTLKPGIFFYAFTVAIILLMLFYVMRSVRVNVTYLHRAPRA